MTTIQLDKRPSEFWWVILVLAVALVLFGLVDFEGANDFPFAAFCLTVLAYLYLRRPVVVSVTITEEDRLLLKRERWFPGIRNPLLKLAPEDVLKVRLPIVVGTKACFMITGDIWLQTTQGRVTGRWSDGWREFVQYVLDHHPGLVVRGSLECCM